MESDVQPRLMIRVTTKFSASQAPRRQTLQFGLTQATCRVTTSLHHFNYFGSHNVITIRAFILSDNFNNSGE